MRDEETRCACPTDGEECMAPAGCDEPGFDEQDPAHATICCECYDECPR